MKTLFACFILILSQGFISCDEEYDYESAMDNSTLIVEERFDDEAFNNDTALDRADTLHDGYFPSSNNIREQAWVDTFDNLAQQSGENVYYGTSHIELISSYFIIPRSYLNNFTFCKERQRDHLKEQWRRGGIWSNEPLLGHFIVNFDHIS